MRIKSPVGDYDYRVTAVRATRDGLEVDGSLGQWQTTMVLGPGDLAKALMPLAALAALAIAVGRHR